MNYEQEINEAAEVYSRQENLESYISEAENAYVLYAFWCHELGSDSPIVEKLYSDWWHARKRAEDIYASMNEA